MKHERKSRYRVKEGKVCIELTLKSIKQLFNSLDPSPFIERDLDDNAVEYILSAAMEHRLHTPLILRIYVGEKLDSETTPQLIRDSIRNYFRYESDLAQSKIRQVLRQGQFSLVFALLILSACLTTARLFFAHPSSFLENTMREGLTIMGWVAMWRPIDTFFYSWWSQVERRRFLNKLAHIEVEVVSNQ
mgnify:CR=1 FL=1